MNKSIVINKSEIVNRCFLFLNQKNKKITNACTRRAAPAGDVKRYVEDIPASWEISVFMKQKESLIEKKDHR